MTVSNNCAIEFYYFVVFVHVHVDMYIVHVCVWIVLFMTLLVFVLAVEIQAIF